MEKPLRVTYEITCAPGEDPVRVARAIALEQTVEVGEDLVRDPWIADSIVGQVSDLDALGEPGRFRVSIGYNPEIVGRGLPQFLNVLYGNISIKSGIRVVGVELPDPMFRNFPGPSHGVEGLRRVLGVYDRPLACTALKPMGTSAEGLAAIAEAFVRGGGDIVKDDHGLADQSFCPFEERVVACQEAVTRANAATGRRALYFSNVAAGFDAVEAQVEFSLRQGVRGIVISPFLVGLDTVRHLASKYGPVIMAHPAFSGTHFNDRTHGITPAVLLGRIFRLIGADASVYPNAGGRFGFTSGECDELNDALRGEWGPFRPSFPTPAGGMELGTIADVARRCGRDTILLVGGSLLGRSADLRRSTEEFLEALRGVFGERLETPGSDPVSACELPPSPSGAGVLEFLACRSGQAWEGRVPERYKDDPSLPFAGVTRHELVGRFGENTRFDLRYFQIEPGGYTSLEKHRHEHVIIAVRGRGTVSIGERRILLAPYDIAYIAPMEVHQIRNEGTDPFGFFCIVDHERDRPMSP